MADQIDQITTDATRPKSVKTETGSVDRHSLPDQIAAAKFILGQAGAKTNKLGIRFRKFLPQSVNGQVIGGDGDPIDGQVS